VVKENMSVIFDVLGGFDQSQTWKKQKEIGSFPYPKTVEIRS
jgi:hypothetical protein